MKANSYNKLLAFNIKKGIMVQSKNASQLMIKAAGEIYSKGTENALGSILMDNLIIELENPRSRHIALAAHQTNIFKSIANTFWYMAGGTEAYNPYYRFFNRSYDQFVVEWKAKQFQSVISEFDPANSDTIKEIKHIIFEYDNEDVPNIHMFLYQEYLNPNTVDPFEYSFLFETLCETNQLNMGSLTITGETGIMSGNSVCRMYPQTPSYNESHLKLGGPICKRDELPDFYGCLVAQFGSMLTSTTTELKNSMEDHWNDIESLFDKYHVSYGGVLYEYVSLLYTYVLNRAGVKCNHHVTGRLTGDLLAAVTFTPERNFELME